MQSQKGIFVVVDEVLIPLRLPGTNLQCRELPEAIS